MPLGPTPSSWQPQTDLFDGARSEVVESALAVRSERTGKPLAYMEAGPRRQDETLALGAVQLI